jgi:surface antigen
MSFNKAVAALAIIFAVTVIGGHITYADSNQSTKKADATKSEPKKPDPVMVTVAPGDSLSSIADAHQTTWVRIYDANESITNPDLINPGDTYRIPTDDEQLPDRLSAVATTATPVAATTKSSVAPAARAVSSASVGNRYTWGTCTWYVYNRKPNIGSFWGNASQWLGSAQASGFATGSTPVVGAIGVESGHVVYVESVNGGTVSISEMNYAGGVGVVHYRTVPASEFYYIYA